MAKLSKRSVIFYCFVFLCLNAIIMLIKDSSFYLKRLTGDAVFVDKKDISQNFTLKLKGTQSENVVQRVPLNFPATDRESTITEKKQSPYKIVLYHFYHTLLKWKAKSVDMSKCGVYKNCVISHQNKCSETPVDADIVVFQGNHMPKDLPRRSNSDQVFVYANIESPQYLQAVNLQNPRLFEFFNWTMSYRFDSDVPYLYGSVIPKSLSTVKLHTQSEKSGKVINYRDFLNLTTQWPNNHSGIKGKDYDAIFDQKSKSSVWFVSHCSTASKREKYVLKMQSVTQVDIFGKCSIQENICPKNKKNCTEHIDHTYKFVFAFENSLCVDYITEKVFNRYNLDMITVVQGAHNYSRYLPKGTYIDANDFATPQELGEFLNYVGSNREVYTNYLKLKDQYKAIFENTHVQLAYCTLCYRINNLHKYKKPAVPLRQWWFAGGVCNNPTILDSILKPRIKVSNVKVPK
ncbi:hypothetical protein ACF0H5_017971 [Mactra antiquata]